MFSSKKIFTFFSLLVLCFSSLLGKIDYRSEDQPIAIHRAIDCPNQGVLKKKDNGFVYLDVSNAFIEDVVPLLDLDGTLRQRPTSIRSMGAHISVFHESEEIVPQELGETFHFYVDEIRSFILHTRDGLKKLWIIAVDAPELEVLREKYGLSPKLKGHSFHITLGKQMPTAPDGWESIEDLSPFHFSHESTEGLIPQGDFVTVEDSQVLQTAAKVDAIGQLKLKSNGYVYVDVDNAYVDKIWTQLPTEGEFKPLSTKVKKMGAHISVIYEDEMIRREVWNLKDTGYWFNFEVKELRYVDRGQRRLWLLAVDAPALERLRKHYGLKAKLQGHDFHITIGVEQLPPAA